MRFPFRSKIVLVIIQKSTQLQGLDNLSHCQVKLLHTGAHSMNETKSLHAFRALDYTCYFDNSKDSIMFVTATIRVVKLH